MQSAAQLFIMYGVVPASILAGLLDWACHRRTGIAKTSGLPENLLHLLMFAQVGLGMLATALLEINGAVVLAWLAVFVAHEATVYVDLRYTVSQREVGPFEQVVHSFLEMVPVLALALSAVIAWPLDDFAPRVKREPWPMAYLLGASAAIVLFNVIPLLHETWSCARGVRRRIRPTPGPR